MWPPEPEPEPEPEQLPRELVGLILCRVPTKSLARFRVLCKEWNSIWEDKSFLNTYFACRRPQFLLRTNFQIYSVDINLNLNLSLDEYIEVRDISLDNPLQKYTNLAHCDGLLLTDTSQKGFAIWNPWINQTRYFVSKSHHQFKFCGFGYDRSRPETGYKIFGYCICFDDAQPNVAIYECKSDAWKFINVPYQQDWRVPEFDSFVSLNGNLYWIGYDSKTHEYSIRSFDFATELFKSFCFLPHNEELCYTQVLSVFRGDRFSLLRQAYMTGKIEIFVTKHKIDGCNVKAVTWISFMTVLIPNFPRLQHKCLGSKPSFFVDNFDGKRLFVCANDETGQACIYIVMEDVFKKIPLDYGIDFWPSHSTYVPSFVPIPFVERDSKGSKV